jgi:hypothetical protein
MKIQIIYSSSHYCCKIIILPLNMLQKLAKNATLAAFSVGFCVVSLVSSKAQIPRQNLALHKIDKIHVKWAVGVNAVFSAKRKKTEAYAFCH